MRALSYTRPWAELVVGGFKDIENRPWTTDYRGRVLVHAAKSWDHEALDFAEIVEAQLGRNLGVRDVPRAAADHPTGILGTVELLDICSVTIDPRRSCRCSPWAVDGQHHWQLGNFRRFAAPIPCRGALGLWRVPADIAAAIEREVARG